MAKDNAFAAAPLLAALPIHSRPVQVVVRSLRHWRYRLFQRHRYGRLVLEDVAGHPVLVLPAVFNPKLLHSGEFLARNLDDRLIPAGASVLDLGTGTGIGAITAARWAGRVIAVDINPAAVRCARINVLLNRCEHHVEVREGDLFGPVGIERFDIVLFNPPFYRGVPRDALDQAWRATDVVERFAAELADHLHLGGCALAVLSTVGDTPAFLAAFRRQGLVVTLVTVRDLIHESLALLRLRRAGPLATFAGEGPLSAFGISPPRVGESQRHAIGSSPRPREHTDGPGTLPSAAPRSSPPERSVLGPSRPEGTRSAPWARPGEKFRRSGLLALKNIGKARRHAGPL